MKKDEEINLQFRLSGRDTIHRLVKPKSKMIYDEKVILSTNYTIIQAEEFINKITEAMAPFLNSMPVVEIITEGSRYSYGDTEGSLVLKGWRPMTDAEIKEMEEYGLPHHSAQLVAAKERQEEQDRKLYAQLKERFERE